MTILSRDLKEFRKNHRIHVKSILPYNSNNRIYQLEKNDHEPPYNYMVENVLEKYMEILKKKEIEKNSDTLNFLSYIGDLERKLYLIDEEIKEKEIELNALQREKRHIENEISFKKESLKTEYPGEFKKVIEMKGTGSSVVSAHKLEAGNYRISLQLPNEPVSFAIVMETLDNGKKYKDIQVIENENFYIRENGYFLFSVFATEGKNWSFTIFKVSEAEELLLSDLKVLELEDQTLYQLGKIGISTVKNLLKISIESLNTYIDSENDKEKIIKKLDSIGVSLKKATEVERLSIEELNFSARTYNALSRYGIENVELLTKYSREELLEIRNLGNQSIEEIEDTLKKLDLSLSEITDSWSIQRR